MFGQNPIRKRESNSEGLLQIVGLPWFTTQGEGPYAGHSAVFVRTTGCNQRCTFCDTEWKDETDPYISVSEILEVARSIAPATCKLCVVTGGEPLRQDMDKLVLELVKRFEIIQFETAGTLWQPILLHPQVRVVCSPKTPKIHPKIFEHAHAFKYVVIAGEVSPEDGLPIGSTQRPGQRAVLARPRPGAPVYLSPCDLYDKAKTAANLRAVVASAQVHGYVAGVQLHKIFGVD